MSVSDVDVVPGTYVDDSLGKPSLFGWFSLDCSAMWPTALLPYWRRYGELKMKLNNVEFWSAIPTTLDALYK